MVPRHLVLSALAFLVLPASCQTNAPGSLLSVLRENGLDAYADYLQFQVPSELELYESGEDMMLLAPRNTDDPAQPQTNTTVRAGSLRPRQFQGSQPFPWINPRLQMFAPPMKLGTPESNGTGIQKRADEQTFPSNYEVRETIFDDPSMVNLGAGERLKFVSNYYSLNSTTQAQLQFQTGLGVVVNTTAGPFKYDKGIIYATDSWNIMPLSLSETLQVDPRMRNALSDLNAAEDKENIEETPKVTYFAYTDSSNGKPAPNDLVVYDLLGYTPMLEEKTYTSASGAALRITKQGETVFVNGARVVKPNVAIKNGVVHYVQTEAAQLPVPDAGERLSSKIGVSLAAAVGAVTWMLV